MLYNLHKFTAQQSSSKGQRGKVSSPHFHKPYPKEIQDRVRRGHSWKSLIGKLIFPLKGHHKDSPQEDANYCQENRCLFRGEHSLTKAVFLRRHWKTDLVSLGGKLHRRWSQGDLGATCSLATTGLCTNYLTSLTPQFLSSVKFSNTIYATGLL